MSLGPRSEEREHEEEEEGLGPGEAAGVAVGVIVGILFLTAVCCYLKRGVCLFGPRAFRNKMRKDLYGRGQGNKDSHQGDVEQGVPPPLKSSDATLDGRVLYNLPTKKPSIATTASSTLRGDGSLMRYDSHTRRMYMDDKIELPVPPYDEDEDKNNDNDLYHGADAASRRSHHLHPSYYYNYRAEMDGTSLPNGPFELSATPARVVSWRTSAATTTSSTTSTISPQFHYTPNPSYALGHLSHPPPPLPAEAEAEAGGGGGDHRPTRRPTVSPVTPNGGSFNRDLDGDVSPLPPVVLRSRNGAVEEQVDEGIEMKEASTTVEEIEMPQSDKWKEWRKFGGEAGRF